MERQDKLDFVNRVDASEGCAVFLACEHKIKRRKVKKGKVEWSERTGEKSYMSMYGVLICFVCA